MTETEFCYWLKGFFELTGVGGGSVKVLNRMQTQAIKEHLDLVFLQVTGTSEAAKVARAAFDKELEIARARVQSSEVPFDKTAATEESATHTESLSKEDVLKLLEEQRANLTRHIHRATDRNRRIC